MRSRRDRLVPLIVLVAALAATGWSCAPEPSTPEETPTPVETPADPDDPTLLQRPFTAEQIRDAWVEGLVLDIEIVVNGGTALQRWTVVDTDERGAMIEYSNVDFAGNVLESQVLRSEWVELRDHASFPLAHSERQPLTRATPLGELEGWLYTVRDPAADTVSEFFFARSFPGAPVHVVTRTAGTTTSEMTQLARRRPE